MALLRLQKIIARAGLASLRKAEKMIAAGRVAVDGQVVQVPGTKVDPQKNKVSVDGQEISASGKKFYYLFNKPAGYLTTKSDPAGRPTIMDLLGGLGLSLNPVGRLDFDTEGLLLLTNDGDLIFKLTHPKFEIEKEYLVEVSGRLTEAKIKSLEQGVVLEDGLTAPARVSQLPAVKKTGGPQAVFHLIIHEGRKRQIRRMCETLRMPVIYLKRIRVGPIILGTLKTGTWRPLSEKEVESLKEYVIKKVKYVRAKNRKK